MARFRSYFDLGEERPVVDCSGSPTMAKQEFKEECDINVIMAKYTNTGVAPGVNGVARYGDFSDVDTYHAAQNVLRRAEEQFARMPSKVRDRFKNDAAAFLAFVNEPKNFDEAAELGLLQEEVVAKKKAAEEVVAKKKAAAAAAAPAAPPVPVAGAK